MVSPVLGTAARLVTNGDASWYRAPALSICPEIVHGVTQIPEPVESISRGTGIAV